MKPGDILETAIWLDGTETPEQRKVHEKACQIAVARAGEQSGMVLGPIVWAEKRPGEDRVPPVPDNVSGPDVRLLVAEAKVICNAPHINLPGSFVSDLDPKDLARLRAITRKSHQRFNPGAPMLSDAACDRWIEGLGPDAALDTLRKNVDHGVIEWGEPKH